MKPVTARAKDLGNDMSEAKAEARHKAAEALHREMYGDTDGLYGNATYAANAAIDAYEAALEKTHVLVPREPTEAMLGAVAHLRVEAKSHPMHLTGGFADVYRAMIAAAEGK